jgi:predicted N-acyltransferase
MNYSLTWTTKIAEISQTQWNKLAKPLKTPFLEWEWLHNLEASGSASPSNGWQPFHLVVWEGKDLVAAAPLYIKGHSYGEFVFDHQWADLSHRLGIGYYPKLLGMTPFTPAVGYRFLIADDRDETILTEMMLKEIDRFCHKNQLSGCNFLFVDPNWRTIVERYGFKSWLHYSYIWSNNNCQSFDDYLGQFNANQRRNIKRERKAVYQIIPIVKVLEGEEIPQHLFTDIYRFYSSTCDKFYWGSKYLTKKFFDNLYPDYRHRVVLVAAYRNEGEEKPLGLSFCLRKDDRLYGRYWGCFEEYDCLHFEACYYKPIDWAIQQNIQMFDPGAGGSHKRRRGFPATPNYSLHRFYHPRMSQILHHYIDEINRSEWEEIEAINNDLPFSKREIKISE